MANFYANYPGSGGGGSGSNASVGLNGQPIPTSATLVAGENPSLNLQPLQTDASGNLLVSLAAEPGAPLHVIVDSSALPSGAATSANQTTEITTLGSILLDLTNGTQITQITGTVPLPTGAATAANQATEISSLATIATNTTGVTVAQGSTTSGQTGQLIQGAVSTSAPTYSNGQTDPLSLTTAGALRVDASGSTAPLPTGAATAANQTSVQGTVAAGTAATSSELVGMVYNSTQPTLTNGQQIAQQSDALGNSLSVLTDLLFTGQSAQTATVNNIIPATSSANATDAANYRSASVQIISTGTGGTFIFEGSNDNSNFQSIPVYSQLILTGTPITAAITPIASQLVYTFPIQTRYIRVRIATTITGGSIQAFTRLSQASWFPAIVQVAQATAGNLNATIATPTVNQGTAAVIANSWYAKLSDSTTGPVKVQPASTTPAAADIALTVAVSPNSPLKTSAGQGTLTDASGTTSATPSTSTTLMASNAARKYLFVQNSSLTNTIWINFTTAAAATQPSIQLLPGAAFSMESNYVSTEAVTVLSTAASSPYSAKQG